MRGSLSIQAMLEIAKWFVDESTVVASARNAHVGTSRRSISCRMSGSMQMT